MNNSMKEHVQRLLACLLGSVVLAIMIGKQEGTATDFGISFHKAVLNPRIVVFLLIGVVIYLAITFWPLVRPYIRRPGVVPAVAGVLVVIISHSVMNWYDPANAKFGKLGDLVDATSGLDDTTGWFFGWLGWTLGLGVFVLIAVGIITRIRPIGYVAGIIALAGAVLAYTAHADVVDYGGTNAIDHSLGVYADIIGFLVLAGAGLIAARAQREVADPRGFATAVVEWRPGLPFAAAGALLGIFALTFVCWFSPTVLNDDFSETSDAFSGTDVSSLASQYLDWLGWVLFAIAALGALAAAYLRHRIIGWASGVVALVGVVLTFFSLKSMTRVAADVAPQNGANWKNLGVGGFLACLAFTLLAAGATQAAMAARPDREVQVVGGQLPFTRMVNQVKTARGRAVAIAGLGLALFYPPMLPSHWQTVIVSSIGVYVLLAVGLNVVVGWAGLLDLGYIAFYEVGAYTTAYFVGALPKKPPHWLQLSPLATIPFAIIFCLIAGVLLGGPTLRLRGDYLAIVTLGFGEIIQLMGINDFGNLTGGTVNAPNIPHPTLDVLGLHIKWGQDYLPYWYLLLIMLVVVVVLFWKLEGSRLGRAWAAIREDEVAAQASGINTLRVKLLAFAIGASTSGLAGVFYASQVGYFDPTLFTLQLSILIVAYVVFGGMGSIAGAMAGAAVLTWLPEFLKDQVPTSDRPLWVGALLLVMMIFRPAGLLPAKRRKAELAGLDGHESAEVSAVPASEGL